MHQSVPPMTLEIPKHFPMNVPYKRRIVSRNQLFRKPPMDRVHRIVACSRQNS
uniref:Uncharacterized protein n=1 Tax=Lutzomyia longipalpis TaxID=7200 RepID=A0A1B0CK12_LUTLO